MPGSVRIQGVGKSFRRIQVNRSRSIKQALFRGLRGVVSSERFWALRGIDLEVEPGSIVGIIGHNGAGKSTLLRLIGGIGRPEEGSMRVTGRIAGLLDLGAGFHSDLSGRENVLVNGVIAGLTRREVRNRFDAIVEFAELEEFIDSPLRTYSQGMRQRLGFAVATHADADVLLIDEMLAVGDQRFNHKCLERIQAFKAEGCAIVLASHQLPAVRSLCDKVIQLRRGKIIASGSADTVVQGYEDEEQAALARSEAQGEEG